MEEAPTIQKLEPTGAQVRAARAYLGYTQAEMAERLDAAYLKTLRDFEGGKRETSSATRQVIGLALLRLGIRFDDAGNMILPPDPSAPT